MDPYYTITGNRPDLAALEVNPPEQYIGAKLVPTVFKADKSGTIYYSSTSSGAIADVTAQINRVSLAAPDSTAITNSNTTFTCVERIKRGEISPDEAKSMGGIAKADMVGAKFAKRSVMNYMESQIATITTGSAADTSFDAAKFLGQAQTALDTIRRYYGKTTLVGGTINLKRMVQALLADSSVGKVLSRVVSGASPSIAAQGLGLQSWLNGVALLIGVDQVLAGDDAIWNAGANSAKICIGKFDDGADELVYKYEPVFARNFVYLPDGGNGWFVESIGDRNVKSNKYDASVWNDVVQLNAAAVYVFEGIPS